MAQYTITLPNGAQVTVSDDSSNSSSSSSQSNLPKSDPETGNPTHWVTDYSGNVVDANKKGNENYHGWRGK